MDLKELVRLWFQVWEAGDFENIPVEENFKHTSPYGTIESKKSYLGVVEANKDAFLGGHFDLQDEIYYQKAIGFASKAKDATQFLAENLPLRDGLKSLNLKVAYDDPCHLVHAQGIYLQPRQLLNAIPGIELVELPESSWCCGSAGTYNMTHATEAEALLKRKMGHVRGISPDVLTTANTGCYIQLSKGVKEAKLNVKVLHVLELLDQAYR